MGAPAQDIALILIALDILTRHQQIRALYDDPFGRIADVEKVTALIWGDTAQPRRLFARTRAPEHRHHVSNIHLDQSPDALMSASDR